MSGRGAGGGWGRWLGPCALFPLLAIGGCNLDTQGLGMSGGSPSSAEGGTTSVGGPSTGPAATAPSGADAAGSSGGWATTAGADDTTGPVPGTTADGSSGSSDDTGPPPGCEGGLWWEVDFSVDPTTLDANGDGVPDWARRDGQAFPVNQLTAGGVWASSPGITLDTRPLDDFGGRTVARVRMRNTTQGGRGAVMWLNVGYEPNRFAAVYVSLTLQPDGSQRLVVVHRPDGGDQVLVDRPGLGGGFVEIALDLDADAQTIAVEVEGADEGTFALGFQPRNGNDDRWATLLAWDSEAEFDHARVDRCR